MLLVSFPKIGRHAPQTLGRQERFSDNPFAASWPAQTNSLWQSTSFTLAPEGKTAKRQYSSKHRNTTRRQERTTEAMGDMSKSAERARGP
jgi:hypothetical protein